MSVLLICVLFFYYFKYDRVRTLRASLGQIAGEPLSFSADSGFYEKSFVLHLQTDKGIPGDKNIEIHYTFNGDDPTADTPLYTDGIDLEEVIRQLQTEEKEKAKEIAVMRKEAAEAAATAAKVLFRRRRRSPKRIQPGRQKDLKKTSPLRTSVCSGRRNSIPQHLTRVSMRTEVPMESM